MLSSAASIAARRGPIPLIYCGDSERKSSEVRSVDTGISEIGTDASDVSAGGFSACCETVSIFPKREGDSVCFL